jgi:hypothetical protein
MIIAFKAIELECEDLEVAAANRSGAEIKEEISSSSEESAARLLSYARISYAHLLLNLILYGSVERDSPDLRRRIVLRGN